MCKQRTRMVSLGFIAFWMPVAFLFVVAASYLGAKLALRSYHEGINPNPFDFTYTVTSTNRTIAAYSTTPTRKCRSDGI